MLAQNRTRVPSYRLHRPSGRAVVTLSGRDHYLGAHGSPESRAEYDRLVAEWLAHDRRVPVAEPDAPALRVADVLAAFWLHAERHYRKDGAGTSELDNIRDAMRPVRRLYAHTTAEAFGPVALRTIRDDLIRAGLARTTVNARVNRVRRIFRWAVSEQMVPAETWHALTALPGLQRGRSEARECEPVHPVSEADATAVLPYVSRQVAAMIRLQLLTGMRPGEVAAMRLADIERGPELWEYRPASHKCAHLGKPRIVQLGPRAQAVLQPFLTADPARPLFRPCDAEAQRHAQQRDARRTPMTPSQRARRAKTAPKRAPGETYTTVSYGRAIARGCLKAGVGCWSPNQLRHAAATAFRRHAGIEAARVALGHTSATTTEVYAEVDREHARRLMLECG